MEPTNGEMFMDALNSTVICFVFWWVADIPIQTIRAIGKWFAGAAS